MHRSGSGPRVAALAVLAAAAVAAGGCAAISGLGDITEEQCAPNCDGGVAPAEDGASPPAEASSPNDATLGQDTQVTPPSDGSSGDTGSVTMGNDGGSPGHDGSTPPDDAGVDAPVGDTGTPDAGPPEDAGCGPVDTVDNCSACGDKCATSGSPACNGTTCLYSCPANTLDCNKTAPDLDGCECTAPSTAACCSNSCPIAHTYDSNLGAAAAYYSCTAAGTYSLTTATAACAAYTGDSTQCDDLETFGCSFADGGLAGDMICSNGSSKACLCWAYDDAIKGTVGVGTQSGVGHPNNCPCPQLGAPTWN